MRRTLIGFDEVVAGAPYAPTDWGGNTVYGSATAGDRFMVTATPRSRARGLAIFIDQKAVYWGSSLEVIGVYIGVQNAHAENNLLAHSGQLSAGVSSNAFSLSSPYDSVLQTTRGVGGCIPLLGLSEATPNCPFIIALRATINIGEFESIGTQRIQGAVVVDI